MANGTPARCSMPCAMLSPPPQEHCLKGDHCSAGWPHKGKACASGLYFGTLEACLRPFFKSLLHGVTQGDYDARFLLETHWKPTPDYRSGHWLCMHTSGFAEQSTDPDRYAGILCLCSCMCLGVCCRSQRCTLKATYPPHS